MIPRLFYPPVLASLMMVVVVSGCFSYMKDYRDYTMAVGAAYPNEANLAQERVDKYLAHLSPQKRAEIAKHDYLAVEATEISVAEVPGLSEKFAGQTGGLTDRANQMAKFIMIFDAKTGKPVTNEGYIIVDYPSNGQLGVFGGYTAVYIGRGR
jgi:hypothetical protein